MKKSINTFIVLLAGTFLFLFVGKEAYAILDGSSVTTYTPQPIPAYTFDLIVDITTVSPDDEYIDRVDITLPDGWVINSLTAPAANTFCVVDVQTGTDGQKAIWEIAGGYTPGGSSCGPWEANSGSLQYSFIVNVTVPDCTGAPWTLPWNILGDGFGGIPHFTQGTLNVASCISPTVTAETYSFMPIDHPDAISGTLGVGMRCTGINDRGLIVGTYETAGPKLHGFLYDRGNFTTIDYPGVQVTHATNINNNDIIAGYFIEGSGINHGYIYDGTYTQVDYPGADHTVILAINDNNDIAGFYFDAGGMHGFTRTGSTFSAVDYPVSNTIPGIPTIVLGINNHEFLSGRYFDTTAVSHGFLYSGSAYSDIFYPGAVHTNASRINDSSTVCGYYEDNSTNLHGFLYDSNRSEYTQIHYPGADATFTSDLNSRGELVGYYTDSSGNNHGYWARKSPWILFTPAFMKK